MLHFGQILCRKLLPRNGGVSVRTNLAIAQGDHKDRPYPRFLFYQGRNRRLRGGLRMTQRTARRLCRSQPVYDGRAVCFCVTRQSHVTSLRGWFLGDGVVAEGRVGVSGCK